MKSTSVILIFLLFVVAGCNRCPQENDLTRDEEQIENMLEKYMIAVENEDYLSIEKMWDTGDSTMMLGTDSHERLMGWQKIQQAYRNQFSLISETFVSVQDQYIRLNCTGNTAWFSQRMNYNFIYDSVARSFEGIRFTGVIVKNKENEWKIVQGHLSLPAHVNIGK
jgi:ketosteroid isomerase-like protein